MMMMSHSTTVSKRGGWVHGVAMAEAEPTAAAAAARRAPSSPCSSVHTQGGGDQSLRGAGAAVPDDDDESRRAKRRGNGRPGGPHTQASQPAALQKTQRLYNGGSRLAVAL